MSDITPEAYWQFSLASYPEHQAQMLRWQEELGVNVNLALFCLFLQSLHISLSKSVIRDLHLHVSTFSKAFTQQVRSVRAEFKRRNTELSQYEQIRYHLLAAELLLERQEQANILSRFQSVSPTSATNPTANLSTYLALLPIRI